ncbi:MAG: serine/threonine protein kinase [Verrucomicrobia bacterium]|nr:serine/threonine protein kinase [Verrucomicrobiota bacterium]MDI9381193.1 serine/threonine-protein kinase [Verrucomicrobiota bacterium]NMD19334.1 serine/threonine protein kinase [Verrucomicrobiota bacterium]HOA63079.1 serine/threonine-protein kinase [Verrucomicrobiota bacterium]HOF49211.1 serine/threonine-protein kinase [Verrucomicrobiota bacterium]
MTASTRSPSREDAGGPPPEIPDHELLRLIGRGSYGEVWLARGRAMGQWRAVKLVYRGAFDHERPYERAFEGLKQFEPVSRSHPGLVDILQVGRDDAAGFFYCVMELADHAVESAVRPVPEPAPRAPDPAAARPAATMLSDAAAEDYVPLTLEHRIRCEGRLPAAECAWIAAVLAEALDHLHARGLVHRDIKPSNIIFAGGSPKLADVGLVPQTGSARTFVGTEGYVPPEGPGTVQADVYSLGKCICEMAMGKDRLAFPSPPTAQGGLPDQALLLELDAIITRACAPDAARRYRTTAALSADLRRLQEGGSVRQSCSNRRRARLGMWAAAALAVLALAWLGLVWVKGRAPEVEVVRQFSLPDNWPAHGALLGDYDRCGVPEIVSGADGYLNVVSLEGHLVKSRRLHDFRGDFFSVSQLADVDGDGLSEVFASWRDETNLFVSVFNQDLHEIKRFTATGAWQQNPVGPHPSSMMYPLAFLAGGSGMPARVVMDLNTHYARWPRCLRAYDWASQSMLWEVPYAASPVHTVLHDLDRDGVPELLIGCYAPDNKVRLADGEDDSRCYLHAMSATGHRLWSHEVGGKFMRCLVYPAPAGAGDFVYALVVRSEEAHLQTEGKLPVESRVLKFDRAGNELARYEVPVELSSLVLATLTGKRGLEVYAGDNAGFLHVLDADLGLRHRMPITARTHDWIQLRAELADDLDGDGRPELVLQSAQVELVSGASLGKPKGSPTVRHYHGRSLHFYNARLKPRTDFLLTASAKTTPLARVELLPTEPTGRRRLIILGQQVQILELAR